MVSFLANRGGKMSQGIKKHKKSGSKKLLLGVIIFVLIYFSISSIPLLFGNRHKTVLPQIETLYKLVEGEALVIKKESLYFADGTGEIDQMVKEGEMVPVGMEVSNISLLKDTSSLKQELLEIEQKIIALSKSDKDVPTLEEDKKKISTMQVEAIERIQTSINSGSFLDIHKAKESVLLYNNKLQDVSKDNTLLGTSLDSLRERQEKVKAEINSNRVRYYTKDSGIISYEIDGYEAMYLPKDFENYTYNSFSMEDIENKDNESSISIGSPIFKIIDNFEWFMAIKIEKKIDVEDYKVGQTLTLELENEGELKGKILSINITGNNAVVVVRLDTYLHENYNLRFTKLNIINYKKDTFMIPTAVIGEKDGEKGVYIKEKGIVKFRPIIILGINGEYTYIDKGNNNGYITFKEGEEARKTITLFDEIFIEPSKIKEGQILR